MTTRDDAISSQDTDELVENFDHHDQRFSDDAPEVWAAMRERCPVSHSDRHGGFWTATGFDEIEAIAHDTTTFSSRVVAVPSPPGLPQIPPLNLDPPDHRKFRRLLVTAFAPRQIRQWTAETEDIAAAIVDELVGRDVIDGVSDFAARLPVRLMSRMLGVDERDGDDFGRWIKTLASHSDDDDEATATAMMEVFGYLSVKVAEHEAEPREDTITTLLEAEIDGDRLTNDEVLSACFMLLAAGIDTTWNTLGSTLHHLATHPSDRRRLVDALDGNDDELWKPAIEEFLRAFAPASLGRYVTDDVEVLGQQMCEGDMVLLQYPAGNRDPRHFDRPDEVIIDRADNKHMAFGTGIHRCLGDTLARMELLVGLKAFLRRIPDFELADGAEVHYTTGIIRGPREVPLKITAVG